MQIWRNQESTIKQQVSALRDQGETGDQIHVIGKILNMKDKLMQQILAGLLYKKTVIWTDLKINPGASRDNDVIYAGQKVVDAKQRIDDFMQQQNYLPSRYNYVPIDHEEQGVFTSSLGLDSDN